MFNNQIVKTIVQLQKNGVCILLTDEGYKEFLKLMQNELALTENETKIESVG